MIWKEKSALEYGFKSKLNIIFVEPMPTLNTNSRYKVRCKCHAKKNKKSGWHFIDSMAIFETKAEANAYWEKNKEWEVRLCEIILK